MKHLNRWIYIVAGVVVMLLAGLIYSWSVFSLAIAREFPQWGKGSLSLVFTAIMSSFCLGGLLGGFLMLRLKARYLLWISALLLFSGFFLSSIASSLLGLMLSYGLLCGLGSGIAYNCIISTVSQWFPDKQGLCSGLILMGFGFSSFIINKVFQRFTPVTIGAWRDTFRVFGIIILLVFLASGLIIAKPESSRFSKSQGSDEVSYTTKQMLRQKSFWYFVIWSTLLGGTGLILISHSAGIALEAVPGMPPATMTTVVGLISIFNGLGRVLFGGLFDRLGRAKTMAVINTLFFIAICITLTGLQTNRFPILAAGFILSGVANGGITPSNSTFIATFFGRKHFAMNFPVLNLNGMIASVFGSVAGTLYDSSHTYKTSFFLMIFLILVGTTASLFIRKSAQPEADKAAPAQ